MSADNYVIVKRFRTKFFYGMFFASDDDPGEGKENYPHGPFNTAIEAALAAQDDNPLLEYGIQFHENIKVRSTKRNPN
jgi:hypothetical protein